MQIKDSKTKTKIRKRLQNTRENTMQLCNLQWSCQKIKTRCHK